MNAIEEYKRTRQILFEKEGIQPLSKIATTNGPVKNVHYLEMGKGRPLILLHGGGGHASEWINIMKPLAEHYHLYVVDRPGHGLTDSIDYQGIDIPNHASHFIGTFMEAVGLNKVSLLGHSMGGYFSLCFSLQYPKCVDKLVLVGAPAGVNRWIPPMLRLLGTKGLNRILAKTVAKPSLANTKSIYQQLLVARPENLSEDYYRHCYYGQKIPGYIKSFTSLLENVLTLNGWRKYLYLGDRLIELSLPVGFIWGDSDVFEKPETGLQKALAIKNHVFEIVPNAGHAVWLDQQEKCAELIISMLNGPIRSHPKPVLQEQANYQQNNTI